MPRYRVMIEVTASITDEVEVWAESQDEAEDKACRDADDFDWEGWDRHEVVETEQIASLPDDPDYEDPEDIPEYRKLMAMGMPMLPGFGG